MCFDAVAAFRQALETELIFIEAPEEHRAVEGQHVLWRSWNLINHNSGFFFTVTSSGFGEKQHS